MRNRWRNVRMPQIGDYDINNEKLNVLVNNLCEEIHFKFMAPEAVGFIKRNIVGLLWEPLLLLVRKYGNYDILYDPDNKGIPDKKSKCLIFVDETICLIKQRHSIPLVDFLCYYQEHGPSKVVAEYAGLPLEKQDFVYRKIIDFLRQQLAERSYAE